MDNIFLKHSVSMIVSKSREGTAFLELRFGNLSSDHYLLASLLKEKSYEKDRIYINFQTEFEAYSGILCSVNIRFNEPRSPSEAFENPTIENIDTSHPIFFKFDSLGKVNAI